jgi:hypothetical protein
LVSKVSNDQAILPMMPFETVPAKNKLQSREFAATVSISKGKVFRAIVKAEENFS